MAIKFTNVVKGQITQGLLKTLLERAGYRVTRLGVEELFNEVVHLDKEHYQSLNLPLNLRSLPDLIVAEQDLERVFLVEVKFRRKFDEKAAKSLFNSLKAQRKYWEDSYAVIMIAESWASDNRFHQDYIRVIPPDKTEQLIESEWTELPTLHDVFSKFKFSGKNENAANADLITSTLRDLAKI